MHQEQDKFLPTQIDWQGVRPIYKKLSDEFDVLLSAFDVSIDQVTKMYLDHLICCIDRVDIILDGLEDRNQRDKLSIAMIKVINGDRDKLPQEFSYPSLLASLLNLKWIADKLLIKSSIIGAADIIFLKTENKRHEQNVDRFIMMVQDEGVATATLPLSIIGAQSNQSFTQFFTRLCRLMGVADLVADARSDYKTNLISFKPSFMIYMKLIGITISEGIKLLFMIPHKIRFIKYCLRFVSILWRS